MRTVRLEDPPSMQTPVQGRFCYAISLLYAHHAMLYPVIIACFTRGSLHGQSMHSKTQAHLVSNITIEGIWYGR